MNIREAVDSIIEPAFASERITGSKTQRSICDLTVFYKKKLTKNSKDKKIVDLSSYIHNKVIRLLKDQAFYGIEPKYGTMLVTDNIKLLGQCLNTGKEVHFLAEWPCRKGDKFPYHRIGSKYYLENYFPGSIRQPRDYIFGEAGNILTQLNEECLEFKDTEQFANPWGEHTANKVKEYKYPDETVWYKNTNKLTFFTGMVYKERRIANSIELVSVDCSAHFSAASSGTITTAGYTGSFEIKASRPVRIIHAGDYAIVQLLREKKTIIRCTDVHTTDPIYTRMHPVGSSGKAYNSICLFSLLVINTLTGETNLLEYSDTAWFALYGITLSGGYTDIQINKDTGELLVVKSDTNISTSSLSVNYFSTAETPFDTDWKTSNFSSDGSQTVTTHQTGYTLYSAKLDTTTLTLTGLTSLFVQAATITTLQGATVAGGCRSLTFTQQPETFDIYLKVHKVGYVSVNRDWTYTPSNGDPVRTEYWQRELVSLGVIEILNIGGTELAKFATTDTGVYSTISHDIGEPEAYTVYKLSLAITYNQLPVMNRMYALRSNWPALEGTDGDGSFWSSYDRTDVSSLVNKGKMTNFFETRFAASYYGLSSDKKHNLTPTAYLKEGTFPDWAMPGHNDILRNEADSFCAVVGYTKTLFILSTQVLVVAGRELSDTEDDFTNSRMFLALAYMQSGPFISEFYDRDQATILMQLEDWTDKWIDDASFAGDNFIVDGNVFQSVYSGNKNYSIVQVSKYHVFIFFSRYFTEGLYNHWPNYETVTDSETASYWSVLLKIASGPALLPVEGGELSCLDIRLLWSKQDEKDALMRTSLGHRDLLKQLLGLSSNALH